MLGVLELVVGWLKGSWQDIQGLLGWCACVLLEELESGLLWPYQILLFPLCFLEDSEGMRDVSDGGKRMAVLLESQFGNHCRCRAH